MVLRIFKMIATSGFLAAVKCTEFVFGRNPPGTPLGALTELPRPSIAGLRGPTSKGRRVGKRERRTGEEGTTPFDNFWIRPW